MKPFRKHVALAIDGGGIRGVIVTRALSVLEAHLEQPAHKVFRLCVGTSTGSIISAGVAAGLTGDKMTELYLQLGRTIFPPSLRKWLFPLTRYRYPSGPLVSALDEYYHGLKMGDFWTQEEAIDLVITVYDLMRNGTLFIKPWKASSEDWPVTKAVLASCTVPTYFPAVENRYIDGGVGSYANPCYVAAYETIRCLNWDPSETTLISIGTGRSPYQFSFERVAKFWAWHWIGRIFEAFSQSAYDQQVHLVETYFDGLDFRRFQIDLEKPIAMDDTKQMDRLIAYGEQLGEMIITDQVDKTHGIVASQPDNAEMD